MKKIYTQCDQCNKYVDGIEPPKSWSKLEFYENNKVQLVRARDLCPVCTIKFLNFIDNKGEKNGSKE